MSNEQQITIVGRLTADPELRWTASGVAVASLNIASNARRFDKTSNEWKDEPPTFWRASCWRDMAEHVTESLVKGTAVIVQGNVQSREWTDKDGSKRTSLEVDVQAIGPDLRWNTAKVSKATRSAPDPRTPTNARAGAQQDPWASQPAAAGSFDEPPF